MKGVNTLICMLFILFPLFAPVESASAEEYRSMIRYDRIWEHISVHWDDKTVYYTKFESPEEINGKIYHRLVSFRKARFDYDIEGNCYLFDVDENFYRPEGYLREEDGKVYTLICDVSHVDGNNWGDLYLSSDSEPQPSDLQEKLLYDFTCNQGESYVGLHIYGEAEDMAYKVNAVEPVEIDGEEYRLLKVSPDGEEWYDDLELSMVEGIGIDSEYGCLTTINFLYIPTCPCADHIFNRVLSMDGRVLYPAERTCADIPLGGFLGVESISHSDVKDAPIHDILGRHILEPASRQLYIQDGKKHIAR